MTPEMMQQAMQMLQGGGFGNLFGAGSPWGAGGAANPPPPADTRPPEEMFADQLRQLNDMGFEVDIQDSVYIDTIPPLTVIRQFPEADAAVKINRTVYLTVNRAVPPLVTMPRLVGSYRSAVMILRQLGLKPANSRR